jgi:hypothetical protein
MYSTGYRRYPTRSKFLMMLNKLVCHKTQSVNNINMQLLLTFNVYAPAELLQKKKYSLRCFH